MTSHPHPLAALAALSLFALGACNSADKSQPEEPERITASDTLAGAISADSSLSTVSEALGETGLAQVFDGAGSYTLLAPNNAAFDALGEIGDDLRNPARKAVLAAILRDHILPGYMTPKDIASAIDAKGGSVDVETMGNHTLTFSKSGDTIAVTGEDGAQAEIAGEALTANNGVAIPLNAVLKTFDDAGAG
ncbi:fasciclin domain-containing protein [Croceibacterium aestuarii]|uniref:fasciclin domain-containing protein n=1 Tax=Croceibacterium aestuarii TaxID=3064139 RepID=UPI00272EB1A9|nr:fasciclin domain-containing protein [Croceibacterium sp. D39]